MKIDLVANFLGSKKISIYHVFASGLIKNLFGQFSSVTTAIICTSDLDTRSNLPLLIAKSYEKLFFNLSVLIQASFAFTSELKIAVIRTNQIKYLKKINECH